MLTTQLSSTSGNTAGETERAYFYVDGIPTKGLWLDLGSIDSWADVHEGLTRAGVTTADYGGDVLVADIEGPLARACYSSRFDMLDLTAYLMLREDLAKLNAPAGATVAFINWYGCWHAEAFESAYMGRYDSEEAYAESLIEDSGMLAEMPEHLRCYFDVERFARDLFIGDYYFDEGYVFSCNC